MSLGSGTDLAAANDGSLFITDHRNLFIQGNARSSRIRVIDPTNIINTFAGRLVLANEVPPLNSGEKGPATGVPVGNGPIELAPDGALYTTQQFRIPGIERVSRGLPAFDGSPILLASGDGSQIFSFTAQGRHLTTRDALTGSSIHRFEYDDEGLLRAVVDGDGLRTTVERRADGFATAIVAPNGQRTSSLGITDGNLTTITTPGNEIHRFGYRPGGLLARYQRPHGPEYIYNYDAAGRLIGTEDPAGGGLTLGVVSQPRLHRTTITTAMGHVTRKTWEKLATKDYRWTKTLPDGTVSVREERPDGTVTLLAANGTRVVSGTAPDPRFGMDTPFSREVTVTTPGGTVSTVTRTRAVQTAAGNPTTLVSQTETLTVNGRTTTGTFDARTGAMEIRSPMGRRTEYRLDAQGRMTTAQHGGLEPISFSYDGRGRLSAVVVGSTPSASRRTTVDYDALDRISSVLSAVGGVDSFSYDDSNRLIQRRLPSSATLDFGYDAGGNLTSLTPPGKASHLFDYSPVDLTARYRPPALETATETTYLHNPDREPTLIVRPDGTSLSFDYDPKGRLGTLSYPEGQVSYGYHPTSGLITAMDSQVGSLRFTYDGTLPTSEAWSGVVTGSMSRTYDGALRVASESVNGSSTVSFGYDADGLLVSAGALSIARNPTHGMVDGTTLAGVTDTRSYNQFGELASHQTRHGGTPLFHETITRRDGFGRIEEKTETVAGTNTRWAYSYDLAGRLWQVMRDDVLVSTYIYDGNGNRTSAPGVTSPPTVDAQDRLLTYGRYSYTYTPSGSLATKTEIGTGSVTRYRSDALGNLLQVDLPDGRVVEYVIDPQNRRVAKKVNGTVTRRWLYRGQRDVVLETDGAGAQSRFVDGRYFTRGGATYRMVRDHLGSVRLIVDANSGAVMQRLDYDEYGQVLLDTNPGFQPMGFAGGMWDPDTGLVRFGARDYDPETGRWTSKDPIGFAGGDSISMPTPATIRSTSSIPAAFRSSRRSETSWVRPRALSSGAWPSLRCWRLGALWPRSRPWQLSLMAATSSAPLSTKPSPGRTRGQESS